MLTFHFSRVSMFFIFALLLVSSKALAEENDRPQKGVYWLIGNIISATPGGVALQLCQNASPYCSSFSLESYGSGFRVNLLRSSGSTWDSRIIVKGSCSSGIELDVCNPDYVEPVQMCSDGYPPNVYGYEDNCDRPTPKKCDNGEYVQEDAYCSVSNGVCSDYDSCYEYAISSASCSSSSSRFSFNYRDPNNWDYSCGDIDPTSPDHPNNGGNADGNEYNDPQSPEPPISSGNSDPSALAAAIGLELRSDFGNVERAIRDGINSADSNTNRTIDAINSAQSNLNSTLSDIKSSIQEGNAADNGSSSIIDSVNNASSNISDSINQSSTDISNSIDNGSGDIVNSVNGLNNSVSSGNGIISSQLAGISSKLDNLKTCDPNLDPQNCEGEHGITSGFITNVMDTLTGVFNDENEAALDSVKSEITTIESASPLNSSVIDGIFDPILNVLPQPQQCIPLIFGNPSQPYSFTLSCDFSDKFKAVFGFLLAFYTIQQLIGIIISSAQPRQEGS